MLWYYFYSMSDRLNQLGKIIETKFIGNPWYLLTFSTWINMLIEVAEVDEDDDFVLELLNCVLNRY